MNEPSVFPIGEVTIPGSVVVTIRDDNGKPTHVEINGDRYDKFKLLALANDAADKDNNLAWDILHLASMVFHPYDDWIFNELYYATAMNITRVTATASSEYAIHDYFKQNHKTLLGENASLISKKGDITGSPDAWVEVDGEPVPVEIKKVAFNARALVQLKRYMKVYGCGKGIAMARTLTIPLPENIRFIPYVSNATRQ